MRRVMVVLVIGIVSAMFARCGGGDSAVVVTQPPQVGGSVQGTPLNLADNVTTFAGTVGIPGATDCTVGTSASFNYPAAMTTDGTNIYIADGDNHLIRKLVIATGAVSTVAGTELSPGATDNASGPGGTTFNYPQGITTDGTNLFVADRSNNMIRKIVIATGAVTTLAGSGDPSSIDNVDGRSASFNSPIGVTTDGVNLYVTEFFGNKIRKVAIASGAVSTLAGEGSPGSADNTAGNLATFDHPYGITMTGSDLYVCDSNNHLIRKVSPVTGSVSTVAGVAGSAGWSDNDAGLSSLFNFPGGITTDGTSLYISTNEDSRIRKMAISGTHAVTTVAGSGAFGADDGVGPAATFNRPVGLTTDGKSLFVADTSNHTIRRIK